jgi:hypothetical protein
MEAVEEQESSGILPVWHPEAPRNSTCPPHLTTTKPNPKIHKTVAFEQPEEKTSSVILRQGQKNRPRSAAGPWYTLRTHEPAFKTSFMYL